MTWVTPPTFVSGQVLTAAEMAIISNDLLALHAIPVCKAYRQAAYSDTNSTLTLCPFDAVVFDNTGSFDVSTHLFTAPIAGYYQVNGTWERTGGLGAGQAMLASINVNGFAYANGGYSQWTANGNALSSAVSDIVQCNVGDTISMQYTDWGGGAITPGSFNDFMSIALVST